MQYIKRHNDSRLLLIACCNWCVVVRFFIDLLLLFYYRRHIIELNIPQIGELYFTECSTLKDTMILCFGNMNKKPISKSEEEKDLYPIDPLNITSTFLHKLF